MLYKSTGVLRYSEDKGYKLIVVIDKQIARYYRSLIPKWYVVQGTRYDPHITVVRSYKETPPDLTAWGKYEGQEIEFLYDSTIQMSENYYWLNILCKRLEEIRLELGLPVTSIYTRPPEGFSKFFHTTIANTKG